MHIFVTGAGSFIGKALIDACDARDIRVTGIDLNPTERPGCSVANIGAADIALRIPEGVDAIVHLAAISRDTDSRGRAAECFSVNVMGTLNLVEAARQRNVGQFIFASSEWVYDGSDGDREQGEDDVIDAARLTSEYALSKYVSEINLRQAYARGFCAATILRFGIVYGPRKENWAAVEALLNAVATLDEIKVGSCKSARRYIHVRDVAAAILASVGVPGFEVINVQGPRLVSLGDVVEASARLIGRTPSIVETAANSPSIRRVSDEKAIRLLGWRAQMDIESGLETLLPALGLTAAGLRQTT